MDNSIILKKDDKFFLYTGNSDPVSIDLENDNFIDTITFTYYSIYDYQNHAYHYYNDIGEKLFTSYQYASVIKNNGEVAIFKVTDSEGNISFYRVSE